MMTWLEEMYGVCGFQGALLHEENGVTAMMRGYDPKVEDSAHKLGHIVLALWMLDQMCDGMSGLHVLAERIINRGRVIEEDYVVLRSTMADFHRYL